MKLRDVSIRNKLLVQGIATSAVALALSGVVLLASSYVILRGGILRDIEAQASIVADNTTAAIQFADSEAANETLRTLRALPSVDLACLFNVQSSLLGRYAAAASHATCPAAPLPDQADASLTEIVVVRPVMLKNVRIGTVYLHGNLNDVWKRLQSEFLAILAAFVVGSIGAVLIALRLRQVISRPVLALSATATMISTKGDYSLRATREGQDEIGALVDTFNDMVSQVERREEELRAANRLKDEFLATLSHELRTPLNAIVGWLQLLRLKPNDPLVTEQALTSLERNAKIQVRLIEDLLDVSSIASGKLRLSFEPVDLIDVLNLALDVVQPTADAKSISILTAGNTSPHLVVGDAGRLEQVIWNLLSNAIKFTPPGGHIQITIDSTDREHVIRVEDNGMGISPDFLPHVFDRFRQADGSMTRRHGGLGVGLAIARELADRHGGRILAESRGTGQGAMFSLLLPQARLAAVKPLALAADAARRVRLTGLHVLVVDDERESLELARVALASAGAQVTTATGPEPALATLARQDFDVLVCDIAMPGTDGYELLQMIRATPDSRSARAPAIAATAYADDESRVRAARAGFQGFVVKPFEFDALVMAVWAASQPSTARPTRQSESQGEH